MSGSAITKIRGLGFKLAFNFYLASFIMIGIAVLVYHGFFQDELEAHFQKKIISIAETASVLINPGDFSGLKSPADENTEQYRHIRKTLQDIKRANPEILFIYSLRPTHEKNMFEFVVDADKKPYHIGDKYDISGQDVIQDAIKSPVLEKDYDSNQWGTYLTGYAPIKDIGGRTVGIIGVDYAVDSERDTQRLKIFTAAFIVLAAAFGIASFFVFRRNAALLRPLNKITDGMSVVAEGNADYRINLQTGDEWEKLAVLVNRLAERMALGRETMEEGLRIAEEQKDKVLKVYAQVICSATHDRFRLVEKADSDRLSLEGVLYSEMHLANSDAVEAALSPIRELFNEKGFTAQKAERVLLCISRASENALEHADSGFMQVRLLEDKVRVIISDTGHGIDLERLPDLLFGPNENNPESQNGLAYLAESADIVHMATSADGTVVTLDFLLDIG